MPGPPEAGEAQNLAVGDARQLQSPVTDGARAQKRGGLDVGETFRYRIRIALIDADVLGITAIGIPAGCEELAAQVLVGAAARTVDPADTDPIANVEAPCAIALRLDGADDLVTRHDREARRRRAALDLVELRVTDAAGRDFDQNLAVGRLRARYVSELERLGVVEHRAGLLEQHRSHDVSGNAAAVTLRRASLGAEAMNAMRRIVLNSLRLRLRHGPSRSPGSLRRRQMRHRPRPAETCRCD